jgi:DNA-binding transcriptional LysR family regulator
MDLRQLEMLLAVVEHGGYLQAGAHFHISHSAIHRQVRLLEQEFGERLFVKYGKRVRPSEPGELVIESARAVIRELANVKKQIRDLQTLQSGQLNIGTGTTTLTFFLPPVLEEFKLKCPKIAIHIVTNTADHLMQELAAGNLDLGIVNEAPKGSPPERNVNYEPLFEEEYVVAVGRGHALSKRRTVFWPDLKDVPFILFPPGTRIRRLIDSNLRSAGIEPMIAMELENEEAIEKMIEINLGVGFVSLRRARTERLHVLKIRGARLVQSVAAVYSASYLPRKARQFLDICVRHARKA